MNGLSRPKSGITSLSSLEGLTQKHEEFIRAVFQGSGYQLRTAAPARSGGFSPWQGIRQQRPVQPRLFHVGSSDSVSPQAGSRGMSRTDIVDNYLYFTAGSCGPCRFGMLRGRIPARAAERRVRRFSRAPFPAGRRRYAEDGGTRAEVHDRFRHGHAEGAVSRRCAQRPDAQYPRLRSQPRRNQPGHGTNACGHLRPPAHVQSTQTSRSAVPGWVARLAGEQETFCAAAELHLQDAPASAREGILRMLLERCRKRIDGIEVDRMRLKPDRQDHRRVLGADDREERQLSDVRIPGTRGRACPAGGHRDLDQVSPGPCKNADVPADAAWIRNTTNPHAGHWRKRSGNEAALSEEAGAAGVRRIHVLPPVPPGHPVASARRRTRWSPRKSSRSWRIPSINRWPAAAKGISRWARISTITPTSSATWC